MTKGSHFRHNDRSARILLQDSGSAEKSAWTHLSTSTFHCHYTAQSETVSTEQTAKIARPTGKQRRRRVWRFRRGPGEFVISGCPSPYPPTLTKNDHWIFTAQCTLVHLRGLAIACRLSVCPSVTLVICNHIDWKSWKLIAWAVSPTSSLFAAKRRST